MGWAEEWASAQTHKSAVSSLPPAAQVPEASGFSPLRNLQTKRANSSIRCDGRFAARIDTRKADRARESFSCNILSRACDGAKQRGLSMGWESSTDETAFQIVQERRAAPLEFLKRSWGGSPTGLLFALLCFAVTCFYRRVCLFLAMARPSVVKWMVHLREWPGGASRFVMALNIAKCG